MKIQGEFKKYVKNIGRQKKCILYNLYHKSFRVKIDTLYQPIAKRLIIMVIDALRWDFITGSIGKIAMPVTSSLISNSSASLLQTKVQLPTVTMPRIKVPGFK